MSHRSVVLSLVFSLVLFTGLVFPAHAAAAEHGDTSFVYEGDSLPLEATAGQVVRGTTDLPAGTKVSIRMQTVSGSSVFIRTADATVGSEGRFRGVFDLSEVASGTRVSIVVHHDGNTLVREETTVECPADCREAAEGSGTDPGQSSDGSAIRRTPPVERQVDFERALVAVTPGDTASFTIELGSRNAAAVSVGSSDLGYEVNATVRDGNGDGVVTLEIDTARLSTPNASLSVGEQADDISVRASTFRSGSLTDGHRADEYPLTVYPGTEPAGPPRQGMLILLDSTALPEATPAPADGGGKPIDLGALAALAVGGLLSVVGIGFVVGLFGN